jgi:hypothetical protein
MGRSVSYPSEAIVVTFMHIEPVEEACPNCDGSGSLGFSEEGDDEACEDCHGSGEVALALDREDFDQTVEDFRQHLKHLFPSVESADDWIGREDHVVAENRLARFGISEYCGLVSYWIVPVEPDYYGPNTKALSRRWIASIEDKFVKAFGELTKVGAMSNGEGVYRRISN